MPHATAAVSAQVLCTPYNHAPCHFMQSHIRKVYACLAVTCHLQFWQNDRDLLGATAVTRGWNGYRNKSQDRKSTLEREKKIYSLSCRDSNPRPFNHESGALTTELSPLLWVGLRLGCLRLFQKDFYIVEFSRWTLPLEILYVGTCAMNHLRSSPSQNVKNKQKTQNPKKPQQQPNNNNN